MNSLYQIPGLFLTAVCHAVIIYYLSERRCFGRKFGICAGIFTLCFVALGGYGFSRGTETALICYALIVAVTFSFSCVVSPDCVGKKTFLFITYFCLFSVLDNVMKLSVGILLPYVSPAAAYYMAIISRSVLLLLILVLYRKYAAGTIRSLDDMSGARWWNLALIAMVFYLSQAVLSVINGMDVLSPSFYLFVLTVVSFVMCAVYGVVFSNIRYMKKDAEAALIRQNAEYFSEQLLAMQTAEEAHRRLRHDMRHHLETIGEYAKAGDTAAVLSYIRDYSVEISETEVRQYSVNRTLNNILSAYAGKAEKNGIDFSVKCNAPAHLNVRDIDLIALLGNLLENALHGCKESEWEEPRIEIYILQRNSKLILVCNNTCSAKLKLSGNLPEGKSIGISSILTVCEKYDGSLDYSLDNGICSACAVLNL